MITPEMIDNLNELMREMPFHSIVYHKATEQQGVVQEYILTPLGWLVQVDYGPEIGNLSEYAGSLTTTKAFSS